VLAGPSLSILFGNDPSQFSDTISYNGLAQGDFDQSPVRRYRVLVPFAAALLDLLFGGVFDRFAPTYFSGDFSLPFSFFIVNIFLMSLFGLLVYRLCRAHGTTVLASLVGLIVVLSSRYTYYFAALPLVDSLFCIIVAAVLLGIKTRNDALLWLAVFLGPFAKESFIFIAPVLFFSHLPKVKLLTGLALSGVIVFTYRCIYDHLMTLHGTGWLDADLAHIPNLFANLPLLFSFYGLYKILINIGVWIFLPVAAWLLAAGAKGKMRLIFQPHVILFLALVLVQMLLSGSMERMFYLTMPVFAILCAVASDSLRIKMHLKQ
jgi:hypothetical protein